jgi:ABC-type nitrate/sulfonate/bicarbonate transport system permease component
LLGILVLWQVVCGLGIVAPNKFPSLGDSLAALATLIREPYAGLTLGGHLLESLTRWGVGLCCALLIGIPFGASLAWFRPFRSASRPIFEFLRYIPPLAWVPLAILMWGPSLKAEAFVVFVGAVPPVIINVWNGVASVDSVIVSAARMLGAGSLRTLLTVALPASMLSILTGVRLAVGGGWASLIGAELVGAQSGLGFIIINAEADNRSDYIVAGMLVIGVMGALIDVSFRLLARRFTRWQGVAL